MTFDGGDIYGGDCEISIVDDTIASNSESSAFLFNLLRTYCGNNVAVCCFLLFGF